MNFTLVHSMQALINSNHRHTGESSIFHPRLVEKIQLFLHLPSIFINPKP